jgi:hypothetical protein
MRVLGVDAWLREHESDCSPTDGGPANPLTVVMIESAADLRICSALEPSNLQVVIGACLGEAPPGQIPPTFDAVIARRAPPEGDWVGSESLDAELGRLEATCDAFPATVLAFTQLLRVTEQLDVPRGLVAESAVYSLLQGGEEFQRWLESTPPRPSSMTTGPPVLVDDDGTTVSLILNRPEVHNAYNAAMRDMLVSLLRSLLTVEERLVVVTGSGPTFCSGGDLSEFGTGPGPLESHAIRVRRSPAALLHNLGARSAAQIHGSCIGAGVELPSFCAHVTAAANTTFRLPEIGMGLVPGAGGTVGIMRRIGRRRLAYLALTGTELDVDRALAWSLVDEIAT